MQEHVLNAFPRSGKGWLERMDGATRNADVVRLKDLTLSFQQQRSECLLGQVSFESRRQGYMILMEEDKSVPISIPLDLRHPELLNALVLVECWKLAPLVCWEDDDDVVIASEWLAEGENKNASSKRKRVVTTEKRFYVECSAITILARAAIWDDDMPLSSSPSSCEGMVIGMSCLFNSVETNGANSCYWAIELSNGIVVICYGNQALKMVLRVGGKYRFQNCVVKHLVFGGNVQFTCFTTSAKQLKCYVVENIHNDRSQEHVVMEQCTTIAYNNLIHYQGIITAHPAPFVVEVDSKYKIFLHKLAEVNLWFGLRVGAEVRFRGLAVQHAATTVCFEATWRTELEIIQFASSRNPAQRRFPKQLSHTDKLISTPAMYFALDFVAKLEHCNSALLQQASARTLFLHYIATYFKVNSNAIPHHRPPIIRFLYEWEMDTAMQQGGQQPVVITTLEQVVNETLRECSSGGKTFHIKQYSTPLIGELCVNSKITSQIVLNESIGIGIECELMIPPSRRTGWKLVKRYELIVERFSQFPSAYSSSSVCLENPLDSKGRCMWPGHVSGLDSLGLTRVYMRIIDYEDWTLPSIVARTTTTQALLSPTATAAFFKFDDSATPMYDCIKVPAKTATTTMMSPSIANVYTTKQCPPVLCFVLSSVQVVQARKFNQTFELERRKQREKLGVTLSHVFAESALKLVGRDLQTPMEMEIFVPMESRVLPAGLFASQNDHAIVWAISPGVATTQKSGKMYIQCGMKTLLVRTQTPTAAAAQFPRDLIKLPIRYLSQVRMECEQWGIGACVVIHVTRVMWAQLKWTCRCNSTCTSKQCFKMDCLVEVDDGTDQAQLFAGTNVACELLNVQWSKLLSTCGKSVQRLKQLDFRMNSLCESTSPQADFRSIVLNQSEYLSPKRAYVVRDRPYSPRSGDYTTGFSYRAMNEEEEEIEDYSKFAHVRNWDGANVRTAVRPKLMLKLLACETQPNHNNEL